MNPKRGTCAIAVALGAVALSGCSTGSFSATISVPGATDETAAGTHCIAEPYSGGSMPSDSTWMIAGSDGTILSKATPADEGETDESGGDVECLVPAVFDQIPVQADDLYDIQGTSPVGTMSIGVYTREELEEGVVLSW